MAKLAALLCVEAPHFRTAPNTARHECGRAQTAWSALMGAQRSRPRRAARATLKLPWVCS